MSVVGSLVSGTLPLLRTAVRMITTPLGTTTPSASATGVSASTPSAHSSNVRDLIDTTHGEDYRFLGPTGECLCGSTLFIALVEFDEDGAVASYFTDGLCASCHAVVTLVTEADRLGVVD